MPAAVARKTGGMTTKKGTDTTAEERIATLEVQMAKLQTKQEDLHRQLTRAQVEQWQGRIDDLEVQMHLGAMEANDRVSVLADQLRGRWAAVRGQMEGASSTTVEVMDSLRLGVENTYAEIRKALLESRQRVSHP